MYFLLVSDVMDASLWAQRSWVLSGGGGKNTSHYSQEEGKIGS